VRLFTWAPDSGIITQNGSGYAWGISPKEGGGVTVGALLDDINGDNVPDLALSGYSQTVTELVSGLDGKVLRSVDWAFTAPNALECPPSFGEDVFMMLDGSSRRIRLIQKSNYEEIGCFEIPCNGTPSAWVGTCETGPEMSIFVLANAFTSAARLSSYGLSPHRDELELIWARDIPGAHTLRYTAPAESNMSRFVQVVGDSNDAEGQVFSYLDAFSAQSGEKVLRALGGLNGEWYFSDGVISVSESGELDSAVLVSLNDRQVYTLMKR
jgi:hypothetical protein